MSVPLPTNVQREDACQILLDSGASCLICSGAELARLAPALRSVACLKALIVMDVPGATPADHLTVGRLAPRPLDAGVNAGKNDRLLINAGALSGCLARVGLG